MTNDGLDTFIGAISGGLTDFSVMNLQTIMIATLGLTVGLAIAWFAYRFIKGKVAKALKSGRI